MNLYEPFAMENRHKGPDTIKCHRLLDSDKTFYTCGRPGYLKTNKTRQVSEGEVSQWVLSLPGPGTVIISLLGRKPDGKSEFRFYPFHGNWDSVEERRDKPSFQEWLDRHHSDMSLSVIEHPTVDQGIETEKAKMIAAEVVRLTSLGRTVVVVDSAGVSRTGKVAKVLRTWSEVVHATAPSE